MVSCHHFRSSTCRSCTLLELDYAQQLARKSAKLQSALGPTALLNAFVPSDRLLASRNKAKLVVSGTVAEPTLGLIDPNFKGQELLDCPLHIDSINAAVVAVKQLITKHRLEPYQIASRSGELKYIVVRASESQGGCLVKLVVRSEDCLATAKALALELTTRCTGVQGVLLNIQPVPHSIIEGEREVLLAGNPYITEQIGPFSCRVSSQSFFQITSNVACKLYGYVGKQVEAKAPATVLDLFCGVGMFALHAALTAKRVLGVELSPHSVADALANATGNNVPAAEFKCLDVRKYLESVSDSEVDLVIVNPPRRGLGEAINRQLLRLQPATIIYSSCNPESLARDLEELGAAYQIESMQPFDMFPLTEHFETVVVLAR